MARAKVSLYDSLDGQVALVSGGNRGLGAAVCRGLAALGAQVFVGARDPARVRAAGRQAPVELDVTKPASISQAVDAVLARAGRLDILVNNAGVTSPWGASLLDEPQEQIDLVLSTNLRGAILLTKAALPSLLARRGGRVVNVSSGAGSFAEGPSGGPATYNISKSGLNQLTLTLHGDLGARGLIANAVCPGWVRTQMGGRGADRSVDEGADTVVWLCRFEPESPAGLFWRKRAVIAW